ncbi:DUF2027 domain-containing protein [Cytophagaceae bacterium SJW1-29]|uniref:DUF2027 domain-containing protein n=2 Tax=Salmonirosea aquatica TaxID=2654236 RepID=A0A7C9BFI9_9BACT|nr:DUF2027 domain-containing protein [Cytophagaceae bacterium SJW1-29]
MNIGDKVRLVHGREEGIVYRFLPGNIVEIEIEDGFRIPVLRNELVTISPVEGERLVRNEPIKKDNVPVSKTRAVFAEKGIYLAFVPINDRELTVHLINNTDWHLPFVTYQEQEGITTGLGSGEMKPRTSYKLTDLLAKNFEQWPVFDIQALYFKEGNGSAKPPFQKKIKCRAQSFYKRKHAAPILQKEAYLYQLDDENETVKAFPGVGISAADLRERMLSPSSEPKTVPTKPDSVVDLHLEKLTTEIGKMSNTEKLTLQLTTFEQQLERAIAAGMHEMTFIHGAGNGVLRNELHRRLSRHQNVQFFEDAQKQKFGYGATFVKIK